MLIEIAKTVYAEAGVMRGCYNAYVAVAQCIKNIYEDEIHDLAKVLEECFTEVYDYYDYMSYQAAVDVFCRGVVRIQNGRIYQFRSFKKYSDGNGNPDWDKLADLKKNYDYLGSDSISNEWGHFYFGKWKQGAIDMYINDSYVNNNKNNYTVASRGKDAIDYIVIHYTANPGSTAAANASYYQSGDTNGVSAHYFVDEKGIWRGVREKDIAGHCGKWANSTYLTDCRNANSIGIELCCKSMSGMKASQLTGRETDLYIEPQTIDYAVELVKDIMSRYGIKVDHVIRHYDVHSGRKLCPRPFVGDDINQYYKISGNAKWKDFLKRLDSSTESEVVPEAHVPAAPFFVKVLVPDLNIRSTPTMADNIVGQTGKGIFTITEVSNRGWGKLASGAGYIWLGNANYCTILDTPLKVRVSIHDLNIRTGPGTNYTKTGETTGVGTFTITELKVGKGSNTLWGCLKSGAGWISMDYATIV